MGQRVRIGSYFSDKMMVYSGVPQGSHCGPLLFNSFINDAVNNIQSSEVLVFADDMKLFWGD